MTLLPHEMMIQEIEETIKKLQDQNQASPFISLDQIGQLQKKLQNLKIEKYSKLSVADRLLICRHPNRPRSKDYIAHLFPDFIEISGDRAFGDDPAIIAGFGEIQAQKFVVVAQEKGSCTDSRIHRNFGMPHPEGYRKALRALKLAEKFKLPALCFIDTPGAYPCLAAEERGQGWAISQNLFQMSMLKTPIIALIIGEGCSGGALGIGVADKVGMLEHAYYSVISPEGCASILWKDANRKIQAAEMLKMQSEDLIKLDIIDEIIPEPLGGAHVNPKETFKNVEKFITTQTRHLKSISLKELVDLRYKKFRNMGKYQEF